MSYIIILQLYFPSYALSISLSNVCFCSFSLFLLCYYLCCILLPSMYISPPFIYFLLLFFVLLLHIGRFNSRHTLLKRNHERKGFVDFMPRVLLRRTRHNTRHNTRCKLAAQLAWILVLICSVLFVLLWRCVLCSCDCLELALIQALLVAWGSLNYHCTHRSVLLSTTVPGQCLNNISLLTRVSYTVP